MSANDGLVIELDSAESRPKELDVGGLLHFIKVFYGAKHFV